MKLYILMIPLYLFIFTITWAITGINQANALNALVDYIDEKSLTLFQLILGTDLKEDLNKNNQKNIFITAHIQFKNPHPSNPNEIAQTFLHSKQVVLVRKLNACPLMLDIMEEFYNEHYYDKKNPLNNSVQITLNGLDQNIIKSIRQKQNTKAANDQNDRTILPEDPQKTDQLVITFNHLFFSKNNKFLEESFRYCSQNLLERIFHAAALLPHNVVEGHKNNTPENQITDLPRHISEEISTKKSPDTSPTSSTSSISPDSPPSSNNNTLLEVGKVLPKE